MQQRVYKDYLNTDIFIYLTFHEKMLLEMIGLVWFYGISNSVGYLMPNLFSYCYATMCPVGLQVLFVPTKSTC